MLIHKLQEQKKNNKHIYATQALSSDTPRKRKLLNKLQAIPTDPTVRSHWVKVIKKSRDDELWEPSKTTVICSDHFKTSDFVCNQKRRRLKKKAVPSKALFLSSVKSDSSENSDETNTLQKLKSLTRNEESETPDISGDVQPAKINPCDDVVDTDVLSPITSRTSDVVDTDVLSPSIANSTERLTENKSEIITYFSDSDSIFDTPEKAKLRKDLRSKICIQKKHTLKIQSLRRKNLRLKNKVASFKKKLESLRNERYINNDTHNVFAADLHATMTKQAAMKSYDYSSKPGSPNSLHNVDNSDMESIIDTSCKAFLKSKLRRITYDKKSC
ncbi:DNA transposase THAP9 [Operophtera brumata]|uniref:DNA transposase THAP9 n=1 Tax=Operophtera brumata TaxID=104452 RepID=A0A0L7LPV9_OPEBR|nr:DNA transposase THAP9 [Operophtera brumata]